jgi:hypothetical protein
VIENPDLREPWQVRTVAYHYTLGENRSNEILSYEWHPKVMGSVSFSHLHLQYGADLGRSKFGRAHLSTGRKRPCRRAAGNSSRTDLGSPAIGSCATRLDADK